jgi:hypothetical protein
VDAVRRVGRDLRHGLEQPDQVRHPDPGAHRPGLLRPREQHLQRRVHLLAHRGEPLGRGGREGLLQVAPGHRLAGHPVEEAGERGAGVGRAGPGPGVLDEVAQPGLGDRLEQRLLGREVPVDGARPDAGPGRDLVQRHRAALRGEQLPRRLQDALAVAPGVGAQGALSHPTC